MHTKSAAPPPGARFRLRHWSLASLAALLALACASGGRYAGAIEAARLEARRVHTQSAAPALAVVVVADGRIVMSEAFGSADRSGGVAATADTAFRVGSVSKLFTSLVLARLVERGVIRLDDPVSRYAPAFPRTDMTIGHLAHHLSGIRHYGRDEYINRQPYSSVGASLEKFLNDPLVASPGEKYLYSSYGYNLLGAALENATGVPFDVLVAREVFEPFAMRSTAVSLPPDVNVGQFYSKTQSGEIADAPPMDLSDRIPSGAYLSTASDLAKFLAGIMELPRSTQALLFQSGETSAGAPTGAGMSWRIGTHDGRRYVHHGGTSVGGRAFVLAYPDEKIGVVLLSNLTFAPFDEKEALAVAEPFLRSAVTTVSVPRPDTK